MWVIGDVHGCAEEFEQLLQMIRSIDKETAIIQLGDLIDRGPDSFFVYELISHYNVITVLGNHEYNFILEHKGIKPCKSKARQESHDQFATLSQWLQDEVLHCMVNSYPYYVSDGYFMSHSIPTVQGLMNLGSCSVSQYCMKSDVTGTYHPIYYDYDKFLHGHQHWNYVDINEQIKDNRHFLNLDSGCVYGGQLIAYNIKTGQILRVNAAQVYFEN